MSGGALHDGFALWQGHVFRGACAEENSALCVGTCTFNNATIFAHANDNLDRAIRKNPILAIRVADTLAYSSTAVGGESLVGNSHEQTKTHDRGKSQNFTLHKLDSPGRDFENLRMAFLSKLESTQIDCA